MTIQDKMTVLKKVILIINNKSNKNQTPVLDNFGRDLTEMAEEGKLDPVVGREKRNRTCLYRVVKKQPAAYSETWVGKSAIAEGLAYDHTKESFSVLFNKRVVTLDLRALLLEQNTEDSLKNA
jgi:ATP-dependent Clp protease ATP-binding subunit ClpC